MGIETETERRRGRRQGRTGSRRRIRGERKSPVRRTFFLVVLLLLLLAGYLIWQKKFAYSHVQADLDKYFQVEGKDDYPLILGTEQTKEHGKKYDGHYYIPLQSLHEMISKRFYYGEANQLLLFTTPTQIISSTVGGTSYTSSNGKGGDLGFPISRLEGDTLYVALDYVKLFVPCVYQVYESPNRICLTTSWEKRQVATVRKDVDLRYRGGVKAPVLTGMKKGQQVVLLDRMAHWSEVFTEDGFTGYVENHQLREIKEETPNMPEDLAKTEEYTSIRKPYKINLVWDMVTNQSANDGLSARLQKTKGLNTISPTWFSLIDNAGNIDSLASTSYVQTAHAAGLEVWGLVSNFKHEGVSTAAVLSDATARANLTAQLMAQAATYKLDGINVDFEKVPSTSGKDFVEWIRELSIACRQAKLVLAIDNYVPMGFNDYYDLTEQGIVADYVIIMGYDEHYAGSKEAGSNASISYVQNGIEATLDEVPKEKTVNGLPFYTRIWMTKDGKLSSKVLGMAQAAQYVAAQGITLSWDEETGQNYGEKTQSDGTLIQVWMEDAESIREKLGVMKQKDIGGCAAWRLGIEVPEVWDEIATFTGGGNR